MSGPHPFVLAAATLSATLLAPTALAQRPQPWLHAPIMLTGIVGEFRQAFDVDLDGDVDVVSFHSASGSALLTSYTVWFNDGTGTLTPSAATPLPGGVREGMAKGDFDGDGRTDVVLETIQSGPLGAGSLILPGQANGTFGAPVHVPLPGNVLSIAAGRGNGDTIDDVFVLHGTPTFLWQQRWIFGGPGHAMTLQNGAITQQTNRRVVLDADGDGIDDVAWLDSPSSNPGNLVVHRTTPTGFAPFLVLPVPLGYFDDPIAVDLDGDGDRDLAATRTVSTTTTLVTITNGGFGAWTVGTSTHSGIGFGTLFAGDWDGDGTNDLVLRGYNSGSSSVQYHNLTLFRGLPGNTFTRSWTLQIPNHTLSLGAGCADLDGDGSMDFVDANVLFFSDGTADDPFGSTASWPLVDWDDDGDLDAVSSGLLRNDGTGRLENAPLKWPTLPTDHVFTGDPIFGDFDGDGRTDALRGVQVFVFQVGWQFLGTRRYVQTDDLVFVEAGLAAPPPTMLLAPIVEDTDGDSDLDLVTQQGIWINDGTGQFTLTGPNFGGWRPVAKADVDQDGVHELLAVWQNGGTGAALLRRTGPNTYTTDVIYSAISGSVVSGVYAGLFDVDDDGDLDLVGLEQLSGSQRQQRIHSNHQGVFTFATTLPYAGDALVGDFDGDGLTDLAVYQGRLLVLRRQGPGLNYAPAVTYATPQVRLAADLDQDGDDDAVGQRVVKNRRYHGDAAGGRRQYGLGRIGSGGQRPWLSVTGIVRELETPGIRLRHAPGGTFAALLVGTGPADTPSVILPGVQSYVSGLYLLLSYGASGAPGTLGGGVDVPVFVPPGVGGSRLYLEFLVFDPAVPNGIGYTNGCEMVVGW
jgi:hypothetical protein